MCLHFELNSLRKCVKMSSKFYANQCNNRYFIFQKWYHVPTGDDDDY